jgi:hypothetical protein
MHVLSLCYFSGLRGALRMSNENKVEFKGRTFNLNQIGAWIAFVGTLFMFWQFMRDVHRDNIELRERTSKLEIKVEKLEEK